MKKHAALVTLTMLCLLALGLLCFFGAIMRPDMIATYGLDDATGDARAPVATRIVLSPWWTIGIGTIGVVMLAIAWLSRAGANVRTRRLGAALVWTAFGLAASIWAAYAPAFGHLQ